MAIYIGLEGAELTKAVEVTLTLDDQRGEYFAGQNLYRFTTLIRNDGSQTAQDIRLIVSLENAEGAIVGYRVVDMAGRLSAGETHAIDLTISPIRGHTPARNRVALEAPPAGQP